MSEIERYLFDLREVAEALIKKEGIHEGLWGVGIEFGLSAQNVPILGPEGQRHFAPAAILPVQKIGLNKWREPNNLTVNAAEVNPAPKETTPTKGEVNTKATKKRAKK